MKKYALVAVVFLGAVLMVGRPAHAYAPQELVKNGGFELGNSGDWTGDTDVISAWSPTTWHSGTKGARFMESCFEISCIRMKSISQTVSLPQNASSIVFSLWYKHTNAPMDIIIANADNAADVWTTYHQGIGEMTPTWTQATTDLTAHKGQRAKVTLQSQVWTTGYITHFDDVSIIAELADVTAPTSSAVVAPTAPAGENGWYTVAPSITLSATDDVGGTGVASISYAWDGGAIATYGSALTAPEGIHTLTHFATDVAGNVEATHSLTVKVDSVAPTGTVSYSTTAPTESSVIATLVPSEPVTVMNNAGLLTRTFSQNGIFTFTFKDAAGITGSAAATVANITSHPVGIGPTPILVLGPQPQGKILGATTVKPTITPLLSGSGKVQLIINGKKVEVRPFGKGYAGYFFAQKYDFGELGSFSVAIPKSPYARGAVAVYNSKGKLVLMTKLGNAFSTGGLTASAVVQGENVFLAVGQKRGNRVEIFRLTGSSFKLMRPIQVLKKNIAGSITLQYLRPFKGNDAGLAIIAQSGLKTVAKMYRFIGSKNNWMDDTGFNLATVKLSGSSIVIKK